jgi:polysaccharide deacetylase family protein (PEP-CTERM system associated)
MITVTLDIEDHLGDAPGPRRHRANTERLLDALAARDVRATCFIVGDLVGSDGALIRRIAKAGHEIGLHSFDHRPLAAYDRATLRRSTADARHRLEDCAGRPVIGYRAPSFSLTRRTPWVPEELQAIGFRYSSSVLPAGSPLYGYPGAPRAPFRWPCGLLELPAPVGRVGPLTVPYLGGIYFRYLPQSLIRRRTEAAADGRTCLWSYLHPYDIDADEPFTRPHGAPLWMSLLLWWRRRGALARFDRLLAGHFGAPIGKPFAERLADGEFDAARPLASDDLA